MRVLIGPFSEAVFGAIHRLTHRFSWQIRSRAGLHPPANLLFLVSRGPPRRREYANTAITVPKNIGTVAAGARMIH